MQRILSALLVTGLIIVPTTSSAQTNPGLSFNWGGDLPGKRQLSYRLDYGTPNVLDRYRLRVKAQKVDVSQLTITYPKYYTGTFDPKNINLLVKGKKVALAEALLEREANAIKLKPEALIPAESPIEVVLSNVKNPSRGGMYWFNCSIESPGDLPLPRYIGTWVISIYKS